MQSGLSILPYDLTTVTDNVQPYQTDSIQEIIDLYKRDVDRSLLRRQLARTPEERFLDVMERQRAIEELRRAGREARRAT